MEFEVRVKTKPTEFNSNELAGHPIAIDNPSLELDFPCDEHNRISKKLLQDWVDARTKGFIKSIEHGKAVIKITDEKFAEVFSQLRYFHGENVMSLTVQHFHFEGEDPLTVCFLF
jgi:hypothetical protein